VRSGPTNGTGQRRRLYECRMEGNGTKSGGARDTGRSGRGIEWFEAGWVLSGRSQSQDGQTDGASKMRAKRLVHENGGGVKGHRPGTVHVKYMGLGGRLWASEMRGRWMLGDACVRVRR
jgi:hypothetical protein